MVGNLTPLAGNGVKIFGGHISRQAIFPLIVNLT